MDDREVSALRERIADLEARVEKLERHPGSTAVVDSFGLQAPPVVTCTESHSVGDPTGAPGHPPLPTYQPPAPIDTEYWLGAKLLPRVGAGIVILALAYLVSLGISRGILGPGSIFAGATFLCAAFIGVGQFHRNEREEYGEILTGIGSCGFFLNLAAGHVYQNLYSGEILVASFVLWSGVNLAYGAWRGSQAFFMIGMLGGFGASLMPIRQSDAMLAFGLFLATLVASGSVAARYRWTLGTCALYTSGTIVSLFLHSYDYKEWTIVIGLYMVALVTLGVLSRSEDSRSTNALMGVFSLLSAVLAMYALREVQGTAHVIAFSTLVALVGLSTAKDDDARKGSALAGLLPAVFVAPFGFEPKVTMFVQLGLALAAAGWQAAIPSRADGTESPYRLAPSLIGCVLGVLSMFIYFDNFGKPEQPVPVESAYLFFFAVASIGIGLASRLRDGEVIGYGFGLVAIGRLLYLVLHTILEIRVAESTTLVLILMGVAAMAIGFLRELARLRYAGLALFGFTVMKVLLVDLANVDPAVRVALLLGLGIALLGVGYWTIQHRRNTGKSRSE